MVIIIFQKTVLILSKKFFHYKKCNTAIGIEKNKPSAFFTWLIAKKMTTRLCTKDHEASKPDSELKSVNGILFASESYIIERD